MHRALFPFYPACGSRSSAVALALCLVLVGTPALAQTDAARPRADSVVVPSARPDSVRIVAPAEPSPDAEPTPAPVSARARWTILGACALLTLSTLLLYNVRSR